MLQLFVKIKRIALTAIFWLITAAAVAQQDAQFGQYVYNGLYVNPAYAGFREAILMQAFYRSQWTGTKGAPQSLAVSLDAPVTARNIGLGAIVTKDKIGAQSMLNAYANFSYRLRLSYDEADILAFGLGAGILQSGLNGDLLEATETGDTRLPLGFESRHTPDIRLGIQLSGENFLLGFSANHLFSNRIADVSNIELSLYAQTHYYFTGAYSVPLRDDVSIKPSFLIKDDLHGPASLDLNAFMVFKDRFSLGAAYRTSLRIFPRENLQYGLKKRNAVGLISDFLIQKRYRIGYGFDYDLNKMGNGYGSHEVSLGYYFTIPKERNKLFFCF